LTRKPRVGSLEDLKQYAHAPVAVVVSPSVGSTAATRLPYPKYASLDTVPVDTATLIIVGGGSLMDAAKFFRCNTLPNSRLIVIPSLWGSGAEVSPVVVTTQNGKKEFSVDEAFIPDVCIVIPQLMKTLPEALAHYGCGDAWSHVLEGALSPLANDAIRTEGAQLIKEMLDTGLGKKSAWFDLSTRACRLQANSSVGLIHGIAHTLEPLLREKYPQDGWSHAKLCSVLILPVMRLSLQSSSKWTNFADNHAIDISAAESVWQNLFDPIAFEQLLPHLKDYWNQVVRNPLTRTNHALVRRNDIEFFLKGDFKQ